MLYSRLIYMQKVEKFSKILYTNIRGCEKAWSHNLFAFLTARQKHDGKIDLNAIVLYG